MTPLHRLLAVPAVQICICGSVAAHVGLLLWGPVQGRVDTLQARASVRAPVTLVGWASPGSRHVPPAREERVSQAAEPAGKDGRSISAEELARRPLSKEEAPPPAADGLDGYIPRPLLSLAPELRQPLALLWPDEKVDGVRCQGILHLFIDEAGVVQRVLTIEGKLPPAFEQAAHQAFLGAKYSPGEVSGTRVKSLIRVEVTFDGGNTYRSEV